MSTAWDDDALFVGLRMVDRLRDQVPAFRDVYLIDDVAEIDASPPKQVPAAIVLLFSINPKSSEPIQPRIPLVQEWLVMLAVRSAGPDPDRKRSAFGPLIAPTLRALQGWMPEGKRPLTWVPGPRLKNSTSTSYLPLMFSIALVTT